MSDTHDLGAPGAPGAPGERSQRRRDAAAVPPSLPPSLPPDVPQVPVPIAEAADAPPSVSAPVIESPSDDVAPGPSSSLPGAHRGGFRRALTEPVSVAIPEHDESYPIEVAWAPEPPPPLPRSAPWALTFAVLGLVVSLLVGWGFLIGIVGAVLAVVAIRRPWESKGVAVWALSLSVLSLVYSAGWLWWAATQKDLFAGGLLG